MTKTKTEAAYAAAYRADSAHAGLKPATLKRYAAEAEKAAREAEASSEPDAADAAAKARSAAAYVRSL